jgi:glycosyltransferase involved in cell wall biosynthesis
VSEQARSKRLRVAIVSFYPLDSAHMTGGMRVAVYNLVHALAGFADLDIHVVYCHDEVTQDHIVQDGPITVHYLALPRRRLFPRYVQSVLRVGRALSDIEPDVVHAHISHFAIPGLRAGLPTLLTLHGVAHREYGIYKQRLYDRLRYGLATLYDRYTLPRVQDIVAISPYIMREYGHFTPARWHRIDNPLPDEYFTIESCEQANLLLYAGTVTPLKDIMTLLRAMVIIRQQIPDVRLHIAGRTTDPAYESQLRRFVADNGLSANVDFLGLLGTPAMQHELATSSIIVLPSRQEVSPMILIEAMAAGIAQVATRAGGIPDVVEDGATGLLVDVGDDIALAAATVKLLRDADLRHNLGRRGRQVAESRFRAANVAARYRELYYKVVELQTARLERP